MQLLSKSTGVDEADVDLEQLVDAIANVIRQKSRDVHLLTTQGNCSNRAECNGDLGTDSAGANQFVAELGKEDYYRDGKQLWVYQPPINKDLSRRLQEPRDAYQLSRLRDSERCLNTVRDAPELEIRRLNLEARNRKEMPSIKREVLKNASSCISGEPLGQDAEVHHEGRVADRPDLSVEPSNMRAVNSGIHRLIHAEQAHTPQALDALGKREGWPQTKREPEPEPEPEHEASLPPKYRGPKTGNT
ncbi:protein of unknown function (plasmid) [Cupriavidus taiwanensis]|uniref:hypothetical protein n=1 Tax=Cupriavidus taiwanensis TaxID=164546 RepID=UPI000E10BB34|nr:hypothetical protein [Cupriavidus taiwanensis]SPA03492.1 protein of unknown function [Cupriavidus taiwanensis]